MWGQKAPPKRANGGRKRLQNHKVGGRKRPRTNQSRKSVEAKSAVEMQKWGQKAPSKQQSDGKKRYHSNQSEKSHGGGKCHQTSKMMAKGDTTFKSGGTLATISVIVVVH